ncbi:MAG TPA: ATP-binding protein [Acidimicrobiales bacterium]|nr:ATP-binding protein [Acidimicrobiales bacterium]
MRSRLRTRLDESEREAAQARRQLADSLRVGEALREALNQVPVGILVIDGDGGLLLENPAVVGPTTDTSINLLVRKAVGEVAEDARRAGAAQSREIEFHGPPAHSFAVSAQPMPSGSVVTFVEDVSERRRLAEMRRDFTVNASHELRTPIGALGLLAETLEHERDPATVTRLAARIVDEAERARSLLEDILDLSRVEGEGPLQQEDLDLATVAEDVVARLSAMAERRGVAVELAAAAAPVKGSREQLLSAISNLVDNAIKYSHDGGRVTVVVARDEDQVVVRVTDEGIGIPARDLARIFERFYRVDRGRGRHTGGTGLGLAIVRHVAERHGGEVTVESREGEGSSFTFRLPVR